MISCYASFLTAYPGNVVATIAARDEDYPLATGTPVTLQVYVRTAAQTWATEGLLPFTLDLTTNSSNLAQESLSFPLDSAGFVLRIRARLADPVGPWSAWIELAHEVDEPTGGLPPYARSVKYKDILNGVIRRRKQCSVTDECELAMLAELITTANTTALSFRQWGEAVVPLTVAVADGLVTWAAILGSDNHKFWTANPDSEGSGAQPVGVLRRLSTGLQLATTLTSVHARVTPRPPVFTSSVVAPAVVYPYGAMVYDPTSGDQYECLAVAGALGSELGNAAKWQVRRVLWIVADAVKLLTLADALGNGQEERLQARDLRDQADTSLNAAAAAELRTLP